MSGKPGKNEKADKEPAAPPKVEGEPKKNEEKVADTVPAAVPPDGTEDKELYYLNLCLGVAIATGGVSPNTVMADFQTYLNSNRANGLPVRLLCAVMAAAGNVKRTWNTSVQAILDTLGALPASFVSSNGANFKAVTMLAYLLYIGLARCWDESKDGIYTMADGTQFVWGESLKKAVVNFKTKMGTLDIRKYEKPANLTSDRQRVRAEIFSQARDSFKADLVDEKLCMEMALMLVAATGKAKAIMPNKAATMKAYVPTAEDRLKMNAQ